MEVAKEFSLSVRTIELIVRHQENETVAAFRSEAESVEISGFGRFNFNRPMLKRRMKGWDSMEKRLMEEYNSPDVTEERKKKIETKVNNIREDRIYMEQMKYEAVRSFGRVEEQDSSSGREEKID